MDDIRNSPLQPNLPVDEELESFTLERAQGIRGGWLFGPPLSLIFLIYPAQALFSSSTSFVQLILGLAGVTCFAGGFLWLMWTHKPFPRSLAETHDLAKRRATIFLLALLVLVFNFTLGFEWRGLLFHVNVAAGLMLVRRDAYIAIAALALGTLSLGMVSGEVWFVLPTAALGLWATAFASQMNMVAELQAARQELARRAVFEERLRFARDLHDLLGHSLSLIALKNELASKLILSNPERAGKEIGEAEQVARRALREVREAVTGYRQPMLDQELYAAGEILKVAGIACRIENHVGLLPPAVESMLAWVVREGTTNVVRHSRAHTCTILLRRDEERVSVEIGDDGRGLMRAEGERRATNGGGLAGLAERVANFAGAEFVANSLPEGGFRLCVGIPLPTANLTDKI